VILASSFALFSSSRTAAYSSSRPQFFLPFQMAEAAAAAALQVQITAAVTAALAA
jgi:hypothetical protein